MRQMTRITRVAGANPAPATNVPRPLAERANVLLPVGLETTIRQWLQPDFSSELFS
jgi:hypothetical protein